jgi:hypothetical protein
MKARRGRGAAPVTNRTSCDSQAASPSAIRTNGTLPPGADPGQLALALRAAVQGSLPLAQAQRSTVALEAALETVTTHIDDLTTQPARSVAPAGEVRAQHAGPACASPPASGASLREAITEDDIRELEQRSGTGQPQEDDGLSQASTPEALHEQK